MRARFTGACHLILMLGPQMQALRKARTKSHPKPAALPASCGTAKPKANDLWRSIVLVNGRCNTAREFRASGGQFVTTEQKPLGELRTVSAAPDCTARSTY